MIDEEIIAEIEAAFLSTPIPTEGAKRAFNVANRAIRGQCAEAAILAFAQSIREAALDEAIATAKTVRGEIMTGDWRYNKANICDVIVEKLLSLLDKPMTDIPTILNPRADLAKARASIVELETAQEFARAISTFEALKALTQKSTDNAAPGRIKVNSFSVERSGDAYYAHIYGGSGGEVGEDGSLKIYSTAGGALLAAVNRAVRLLQLEAKK